MNLPVYYFTDYVISSPSLLLIHCDVTLSLGASGYSRWEKNDSKNKCFLRIDISHSVTADQKIESFWALYHVWSLLYTLYCYILYYMLYITWEGQPSPRGRCSYSCYKTWTCSPVPPHCTTSLSSPRNSYLLSIVSHTGRLLHWGGLAPSLWTGWCKMTNILFLKLSTLTRLGSPVSQPTRLANDALSEKT